MADKSGRALIGQSRPGRPNNGCTVLIVPRSMIVGLGPPQAYFSFYLYFG